MAISIERLDKRHAEILHDMEILLDKLGMACFYLGRIPGVARNNPESAFFIGARYEVYPAIDDYAEKCKEIEEKITGIRVGYGETYKDKITERTDGFMKRIEECLVLGKGEADCGFELSHRHALFLEDMYMEILELYVINTPFVRYMSATRRQMPREKVEKMLAIDEMIEGLRSMIYDYAELCYYTGRTNAVSTYEQIGAIVFGVRYEIALFVSALLNKFRKFIPKFGISTLDEHETIVSLDEEITANMDKLEECIGMNDSACIRTLSLQIIESIGDVIKKFLRAFFDSVLEEV